MLWSTSGIPALKVVYEDYTNDELFEKKNSALLSLACFNGEKPTYDEKELGVLPKGTRALVNQQHMFTSPMATVI